MVITALTVQAAVFSSPAVVALIQKALRLLSFGTEDDL